MEKLLDLLIHYEWYLHKRGRQQYSPRIEGEDIILENDILGGDEQIDTGYLIICSKWYGFIEWLVDNDKIDGKKFYEKNILKGFITITKEEKADSIIMNLSISDTPIEDLISYLK